MNHNKTPLFLVFLTLLSACGDHHREAAPPSPPPDITRFALQVSLDGAGAGTVSSAPSGVSCGTDCAEDYASGTVVTLTSTPASDSTFSGWSGACVGTGSCVVTTDAAKSVKANFALMTHTLSVSKSGSGTGTVTTTPAGVQCGVDCEEDYTSGTEVTLTASAANNSTFAGWSGSDCTGTGACVVKMAASATITATFNAIPPIATHHVGGAVSGLTGTLVLQNNGTDDLPISANGSFSFSNPLDEGAAYSVTILAQPATQTCSVSGGTSIIGSADVTNVSVTCVLNTTTLAVSVSTLALATNQGGALTGNPRQITVTNTGTYPATNLDIVSAGLPAGTSISASTCPATLTAGSSCAITITPGSIPSSSCGSGIPATAGTVTISADNSNHVASNVLVLTHGCQYQGGFVYSVDDTTPNTGSIGGKVVSLVDQAAPYITSGPQPSSIIWSSNGAGSTSANVSYDIVPFIAEANVSYAQAQTTFDSNYSNTATYPLPPLSAFSNCDGAADGACNSGNIFALYDSYRTNYDASGVPPFSLSPGPTPPADYAAGLCSTTINGYSDWYLPAVCEVDAVDTTVACPVGTQSMVGNLAFLIGDASSITPHTSCSPPSGTTCLAGDYWTSTERSLNPQQLVWAGSLSTGSSFQAVRFKQQLLGVRCSRALTN